LGAAPAGKITTLAVKEEHVVSSTMSLLGADVGALLQTRQTGELPSKLREALTRAARLRQDLAETESQIGDRTQRLAVITQEQARIREDMKTVSANTPYYTRLLAKLNDQESEIERLQRDREELEARRDGQRKDLDQYVRNLDVS
jgi:chromosome segregation ATPase